MQQCILGRMLRNYETEYFIYNRVGHFIPKECIILSKLVYFGLTIKTAMMQLIPLIMHVMYSM